jgi:hypothetical protein
MSLKVPIYVGLPFILGLSWLAIIATAIGVIVSADVRREQENGGTPDAKTVEQRSRSDA